MNTPRIQANEVTGQLVPETGRLSPFRSDAGDRSIAAAQWGRWTVAVSGQTIFGLDAD